MSERPRVPGAALLTALGLGRLRPAPGTWASLATAAAAWGAEAAAGCGLAAAAALGVLAAAATVRFGTIPGEDGGHADPPWVVSDEVAGQALAAVGALAPGGGPALPVAASFVAFRALDVWKPGWIRRAQGLPGGWGVLADDLLAGLGAAVVGLAAAFLLR